MTDHKKNCFASAIIFLLVMPLHAALITWSAATNISADTDIFTNGNFEYAGYFAPSTATISINGVTFTGSGGSHNFGANVTTSFANGGTAFTGMGAGNGLSSNYQTLLGGVFTARQI